MLRRRILEERLSIARICCVQRSTVRDPDSSDDGAPDSWFSPLIPQSVTPRGKWYRSVEATAVRGLDYAQANRATTLDDPHLRPAYRARGRVAFAFAIAGGTALRRCASRLHLPFARDGAAHRSRRRAAPAGHRRAVFDPRAGGGDRICNAAA